jgi:RND family efflux transporter MFP subunit
VRSSGVDVDASRKTKLARGTYQLDEARARLEVARRALQLADAQMAKTTIRAPFDGRVAKKMVDTNEAVAIGRPIAQIYSTDNAEVRLPLSAEQIELVDVPLQYDNQQGSKYEPLVILEDVTAKYRWTGRVKRSEGFINPTNRLTYLIAIVRQPYARDPAQPNRPPLAAGTFVEATIQGSTHKNIATLPLDALHNMNEVWVLDAKKRLRFRKVDVLYRGRDRVYIAGGLGDGEKVILTPLEVAAENMELAVIAEVPPLPPVLDDSILRLGNQAISSSSTPAAATLPPSQSAPGAPAGNNGGTAKTPAPSAPPGASPPGAEGMTGMAGTDQEAEI